MASVVNIPMYFRLNYDSLKNNAVLENMQKLGELCIGEVLDAPVEIDIGGALGHLFVFHNQQGSHVTFVMYEDGLLTVDVQHRCETADKYTMSYIRTLEHQLADQLGAYCVEHNSLHCPIKRGQKFWPYAVSADERLLELDHEELVYETTSRWQNIRIFRSRQSGNVLFLDGDAMLGEGDLIYTQTLCRIGQEDYRGKTVLVLGGGDGGILHELLKEDPKFVTVAEIDEEVIKACRVHLRGACGDSLDRMDGDNYQILIDDCIEVLKRNIENGVTYDYVINDLTEFPVDKSTQGFDYDFQSTTTIMELSLAALKPHGKILARGNCLGATGYRSSFESDVKSLGCKFIRCDVYVPSFHEIYCLYEICRADDEASVLTNGATD